MIVDQNETDLLAVLGDSTLSRIFVSHAVKDAELVEDLVDLLQVGVGVHPDEMFCSSLPGMTIPTGQDFVNYIKGKVSDPEFVLLVISPEFLRSQFCNNEVGASWAKSLPIHPILVPPTSYNDVKGVLLGVQAGKIDDKECLNDLRDDLIEKLGFKALRTSHWERKRDRFLKSLTRHLIADVESETPTTPARNTTAISSTGAWIKLGDEYLQSKSVRRIGGNSVRITIESTSESVDASLARLRPKDQHFPNSNMPFAYKNDGGFLTVKEVSSTSEADHITWQIVGEVIEPDSGIEATHNFDGKSLTPDDIAELKAGRLLINDPPPPKRRSHGFGYDQMESLICGGSHQAIRTDQCILAEILNPSATDELLIRARLESVFVLKAAAIVESITKLVLRRVDDGVEVDFEGRRPQRYQNEEAETIRVAGLYRLEAS
ncbi:toll/interleukin-1 receptor domain-containing protein [Gimesia chilikensis]|uniref:toll/interleukin-1 receptor domain-containing protein n=1 Tax=Gimesia chilikensis TaxID=2605989 RepID=UPI0011EC2D6A|nr:toll/interleukin-1 receptor domain-containing protein [Gimesia chilikensis]KAA0131593.1 toll/interleukin-1 receptor domain-containing protein [Gimesia chilikensis]